jgi:hypothetical protein
VGSRLLERNIIKGKLCEKVLRMPGCAANQVDKLGTRKSQQKRNEPTKKNEVLDVVITHGRTGHDKNLL